MVVIVRVGSRKVQLEGISNEIILVVVGDISNIRKLPELARFLSFSDCQELIVLLPICGLCTTIEEQVAHLHSLQRHRLQHLCQHWMLESQWNPKLKLRLI